MKKVRILLADLVHNRHYYDYGVPLNIGYVTARLKQRVGSAVETELYKFPDDLIEALKTLPDILALSNYDWNVNLNKAIIKITKAINPDILIIMGGPSIRKSQEGIRQFLLIHPVDMYVVNEGEDGFCGIVEYILSKWPCNLKETILGGGIRLPNTAYLEKETRQLVLGGLPDSAKETNIPFPSPWLSGLLDTYLNESTFPLTPIVETNRGCPYQCTYCERGGRNGLIRVFDLDTVIEELRYIVKKAKYKFNLLLVDANFGILPRDVAIAEEVRRLSDKYNNITRVIINNAKNNIERTVEIAKILGSISVPDFAVQSFNKRVLKNVGRVNIKLDSLAQYISVAKSNGHKPYTDLLLGLPGETKASMIENIKMARDIGFYNAQYGDIRLLPGSPMEEDGYRKKHGIESRFRVIPSAYGEYGGEKVIEYEECIRKTNTMSEEDYVDLRLFIAHEYLLNYFELGGRPLIEFSNKYGFEHTDLIASLSSKPSENDYPHLSKYIDKYIANAKSEWFESEDEANKYYLQDDVFEKIMNEGFSKLNYEYAAELIINPHFREEFMRWVGGNIKDNLPDKSSIVDEVVQFCVQRVYHSPFDGVRRTIELSREVVDELDDFICDKRIGDTGESSKVIISFDVDENKVKFINDEIARHGGVENPSLAIQVILMKDNKVFAQESSLA